MVCSVFNRTPPSLAPEERYLSSFDFEEEEWNACIAIANTTHQLRFFETLFSDREIQRCFNLLPNKTLKYEYFVMQYKSARCPLTGCFVLLLSHLTCILNVVPTWAECMFICLCGT